MKNKILEILEDHAWAESNLSSPKAREQITNDIIKALQPDVDEAVCAEHHRGEANGS
tara:strand:+ start:382 stop:552 length:171 start_codon:yes stop_codon:yes gene_type:complete